MDMLILLYATNIVENGYPFARVPKVLKEKVKEQIILAVGAENTELIEQLTKL